MVAVVTLVVILPLGYSTDWFEVVVVVIVE